MLQSSGGPGYNNKLTFLRPQFHRCESTVLATLLINGYELADQWIVVIGVGLAFFLVQLGLSISFCARMRRQERVIKQLLGELKSTKGGNNVEVPRNFAWLYWVATNFPFDTAHTPTNLTREDVLQELDTRIASYGDYLLLQRMGVMAPLLGVVLTVVGFYWLNVSQEDQSLQSIFMAVTPLVSGVGTGAVLALVNQVLLHIAGRRVESLRMTARTWFDAAIWNHCDLDTQGATAKAVQAMERLVKNTVAEIDRLSDTLARAAEISVAFSALPDQMRDILDRKVEADHNAAPTGASAKLATPVPRRPR